MNVREATKDDMMIFLEMAREFAKLADEPLDRESLCLHIEWIVDAENTTAFIAEDDAGQALGICGGIWFPTPWDNSKITATELWWFVKGGARKAGVGRALKHRLESWAREIGAWRLSMMTIVGIDPGVEKMYEADGYRERERTFVKEL